MKSLPMSAAFLLFAVTVPASAQPQTAQLSMTCHPLFRGVPMKEPTIYQLVGQDLYSTNEVGRAHISTEGKPLFLDKHNVDGVSEQTFASHTVNGSVVTRTVYWQKQGEPMRARFTERYDFQARTITSATDKEDSCHADGK